MAELELIRVPPTLEHPAGTEVRVPRIQRRFVSAMHTPQGTALLDGLGDLALEELLAGRTPCAVLVDPGKDPHRARTVCEAAADAIDRGHAARLIERTHGLIATVCLRSTIAASIDLGELAHDTHAWLAAAGCLTPLVEEQLALDLDQLATARYSDWLELQEQEDPWSIFTSPRLDQAIFTGQDPAVAIGRYLRAVTGEDRYHRPIPVPASRRRWPRRG